MSPAKRKTKTDDDASDTIYAADVDVDDNTTYQPYKPRPTRSRGNPLPAASPTKKRKVQPVARDPQAAPASDNKSSEDEDTIHVGGSIRQRVKQQNEEFSSEPLEESQGKHESEEASGDESEEEGSSSARGDRRQPPRQGQRRLRTQHDDSDAFQASQEQDDSDAFEASQDQDDSEEAAFSQDDNEFEEEVAPTVRKTKAMASTEKKRTADTKNFAGASVQEKRGGKVVSDTTSDLLEEFRVPLDKRWKNCNRFVALVNNGTISPPKDGRHDYKPLAAPRPACYVKDLPEQEGRKYVLVEKSVRLYTIRLDGKDVNVWRLEVRNMSVRGARPFQIFRHPVMGLKMVKKERLWTELSHHVPITQRLCDNRDEVIRLGRIYADLLNRTPLEFHDEGWDKVPYITKDPSVSVQQMARVRRFVEQSSILQWRPHVDFRTFHPYFINHPKGPAVAIDALHGAYGRAMSVVTTAKKQADAKIFSVAFLHTKVSALNVTITVNIPSTAIKVTIADVDVSTTRQQIDVPAGYSFKNTFTNHDGPKKVGAHDMSNENTRAAYRVAQWVHYRLNGMTGDEQQLKTTIDSIVNEHVTQPKDRFSARSYNNNSLVTKPILQNGNTVAIYISRFAARSLGIPDTASIPCVNLKSTNRITHAYVINQLFIALRAGKSLVHAVQGFVAAGDEINLGLHKIKDIKDTFCLCLPADRHNTEHPCMHCYRVLICSELVHDIEGRTLCAACAGQTGLMDERLSLKSYIVKMVQASYASDKQKGTNPPTWDKAAVVDDLMRKHYIDDENWKDGYDGKVSLLASRYNDVIRMGISGHSFTHPKQPSLEKPFPMWFDKKHKKLYLHHPDNLTLTQLCTNLGNTHNIPAMIAWDKVALICMEFTQENNEKPCVGYHASVAKQYAAYDRACDNIYAISMSYPKGLQHRTAAGSKFAKSEAFETLKRQLKSGIFEGKVPRRAYTSRAEMEQFFGRLQTEEFVPWSPTQIKKLSGLLESMQSSPHFNPHGLKFPRNADGSPWFWRPDHRPSNASWEFMNREFQARLWTMEDWCDEENETPESVCTLFLFYAIFFLRTGGKCHIFGCIMTYASGHTSVYSIGRAVVICNNAGQFVREVAAGEAMRSGFSSLDPTDLEKDFDFANCTIIIETWRANSIRSNFPGGRAVIDTVKDTVRQRADKTEFYGAAQVAGKYTQIPPTGPYLQSGTRTWRLPSGAVYSEANRIEELDDSDEFNYFEEDDDEDELDSFDDIQVDEEQSSDNEKKTSEDESEESSEGGAAALEGGTPGADDYATQQVEGAGATAPSVQATEDSDGDYEPRRKVEISSNTMARLTPRDSNTTFLPNSVSDNHPMAGILIVTGIWPNTRLGYPTKDNFFTSTDGLGCGTFDDAGDIFDPELNFLGNIFAERYE